MIVVDASAILEVLLQTPAAPRLEARLFAPGESLHAPHLLDLAVRPLFLPNRIKSVLTCRMAIAVPCALLSRRMAAAFGLTAIHRGRLRRTVTSMASLRKRMAAGSSP